ncbi:MAG: hypothetical protein ACXACY_25875 [Candidatus Hodarchaeales archaeon]|jgi:hypothetical protein
MKIYYEPYPGYNEKYDFIYLHTTVMDLSFTEPEEPRLMREIGVNCIIDGIMVGSDYSFTELSLMKQLLPEQIRVLFSHAYRIYNSYCFSQVQFIFKFRDEVRQLARQEIEPGMFKDEDIL